ncbi:MAG: hypothetical protein ACYTXY_10485, partial [Nostoc sp.]
EKAKQEVKTVIVEGSEGDGGKYIEEDWGQKIGEPIGYFVNSTIVIKLLNVVAKHFFPWWPFS